MAATDITRMSLPSFGLGKIQNWDDEKDSGIVPIPFPGEDAEETLGIDTLGIIAYLNISGRLVDAFDELQDTIAVIKSIMDGKQTSWQPFYSPFLNYTYEESGVKKNRQGNIGVNTSTTTNKLIDSTATFNFWGIRVAHFAQGATIEGDKVKNLASGVVATITSIDSETQLTLDADIFPTSGPASGSSYAVTAHMACKLLSFKPRWTLPGLTWVDYDLSVMQVKDT